MLIIFKDLKSKKNNINKYNIIKILLLCLVIY